MIASSVVPCTMLSIMLGSPGGCIFVGLALDMFGELPAEHNGLTTSLLEEGLLLCEGPPGSRLLIQGAIRDAGHVMHAILWTILRRKSGVRSGSRGTLFARIKSKGAHALLLPKRSRPVCLREFLPRQTG